MKVLLLLFFGALGVLSRYGVDKAFESSVKTFPLSTFLINLIGSFLIGVFYVLSQEKQSLSPELSTAIMVGFLGGFTTFSSYSLQSIQLMSNGATLKGAFYFIGSPILGVCFCVLGIILARSV